MHDIKLIREKPEQFDKALARRNIAPLSEHILKLDKVRRAEMSTLLQKKLAWLSQKVVTHHSY